MYYFILSDIHGNLEALQAVLDDIEKLNKDGLFISLGDIVGYCANPNECVSIIQKKALISLLGNHDHCTLTDVDLSFFNPYAREAILWTRAVLTEKSISYLKTLAVQASIDNLYFVHATPYAPLEWRYIFTVEDAMTNFLSFNEEICFVGHSHQPMIIELTEDNQIEVPKMMKIKCKPKNRYIINVGSIGQPRDFDPRAAYCIYDSDERTVEIRRVNYNLEKAQQKMRDARLHPYLIERLATGR